MKNPSRHRKATRSARRQYRLFRSRRSRDWLHAEPRSVVGLRQLHQTAAKYDPTFGQTSDEQVLLDRVLVDLRAQQQYGVIWDKKFERRRKELEKKHVLFQFLYGGAPNITALTSALKGQNVMVQIGGKRQGKTHAMKVAAKAAGVNYMVQSGRAAAAMTGMVAASNSAAAAYQQKAQAVQALLQQTGVTAKMGLKRLAAMMGASHDDDDVGGDDRRRQIDEERKGDLASTHDAPDVSGTAYGYRIWNYVTGFMEQAQYDEIRTWAGDPFRWMVRPERRVPPQLQSYGIGIHPWKKKEYAFHWDDEFVEVHTPPWPARDAVQQTQRCPQYDVTVPGFFCKCGIWAQYRWHDLPDQPTAYNPLLSAPTIGEIVAGLIRGGGKVVESDRGWRSQWAEVVELYCNGWCEQLQGQRLDEGAKEYEVPVKRAVDAWLLHHDPRYRSDFDLVRRGGCSHSPTPLEDFTPTFD